jgi:GT2 family glycosyltransferase
VKEKLSNRLPLSLKLLIKRLLVGSVATPIRLGARIVRLAERAHLSGVAHGLDLHREWDVKTVPRTTFVQQYGASDFLLLMDAIAGRKDRMPEPDRAIRISIILLCYNKIEFTFQCLRSLLREVDLSATEIIVVNNASTDETRRVLSHFDAYLRLVNLDVNVGCVGGNNEGARHARGEYLVFLNNDTVVLPGWLEPLVETAESDSSVGAVGSMFIYPDGTLQEAGGIAWKTGEAYHYGWGKSPEDRRFNFAREVDYCTSASLLIRKDHFDQLGGFDPIYSPISYEDVDICFGVRSLGQKVVYQPLSRVIHFEGATVGRVTSSGLKRYQVTNRLKFYEKWHDVLEREHYTNDSSLVELASNRKRSPYVLVFDDRVPMPDRDAGSARMVNILKALARIGRPVFVPMKPLPEYEKLLWKEGIETANVVEYLRLIKQRNFRLAIFSRPEVAKALIPSVRRANGAIKVIFDMVDASFIRLRREHEITGSPERAKESRDLEALELKLARASDQVWCASSSDKKAVSESVAEERIIVVPTIHAPKDRGKPFAEREGLLFIGHLSHRPNSDAIHYFMREIFPSINKLMPVVFYIIGSGASPEIGAYESNNVKVLGYVPDIDPFFQSARVFVAPLRFGAGVNGKIGEALSYGLPVVTTSIGAEGIGLTSGENAMIADDPAEFANSVLRVYRDIDLWHCLSDSGYQHIENHFTPQIVGQKIEDGLRMLGVW